ncbi:hypothetical protein CN09_19570 [Rhizobium rhizogenes]|nr:hypothetical protein CN09_19570 [Rhizobium rhizogenes]
MRSLNALRRTSKQFYMALENDEKTRSLYGNLSRLSNAIDIIYHAAIPADGLAYVYNDDQSGKAYAHTRIDAVEATLHLQSPQKRRELVGHIMDMDHGLDQAWAIGCLARNLTIFNRTESNAILQKSFEYLSDDLHGMSNLHMVAGATALVEADAHMTPLQRGMVQTILEANGQYQVLHAATSLCQRRAELRRERLTKWEERIAARATGSHSSNLDPLVTEVEKLIQERVTQSQGSDFDRMTIAAEIQVHLADLIKRTINVHRRENLERERNARSEFGR